MKRILTLIPIAWCASLSLDYVKNPDSYYRDPCPDTRPETKSRSSVQLES